MISDEVIAFFNVTNRTAALRPWNRLSCNGNEYQEYSLGLPARRGRQPQRHL
jgi:hypothetical protein